jgi:hypothetical protein
LEYTKASGLKKVTGMLVPARALEMCIKNKVAKSIATVAGTEK